MIYELHFKQEFSKILRGEEMRKKTVLICMKDSFNARGIAEFFRSKGFTVEMIETNKLTGRRIENVDLLIIGHELLLEPSVLVNQCFMVAKPVATIYLVGGKIYKTRVNKITTLGVNAVLKDTVSPQELEIIFTVLLPQHTVVDEQVCLLIPEDILTPQEKKVFELFLGDFGETDIAIRLKVSRKTAGTHLDNIMRKLNCGSRKEMRSWQPPAIATPKAA
jgi:DNA-binding CsgD family transcriptional regulator